MQVQAQVESLADLASQRGDAAGGEAERFAAQLVYDSALGSLLSKGSMQDSELLRETLSHGAAEAVAAVFGPLRTARTAHARALSQVAALQEALDEADKELVRMREEAEIISIHAASSRAMISLGGSAGLPQSSLQHLSAGSEAELAELRKQASSFHDMEARLMAAEAKASQVLRKRQSQNLARAASTQSLLRPCSSAACGFRMWGFGDTHTHTHTHTNTNTHTHKHNVDRHPVPVGDAEGAAGGHTQKEGYPRAH